GFLIVGLIYVGYQLEKKHAIHGMRAGAIFGALTLFLVAWLTLSVIGGFLATRELGEGVTIPLVITALVGIVLLFLTFKLFTSAAFGAWLQGVEDQGWFHAVPYKPTQG